MFKKIISTVSALAIAATIAPAAFAEEETGGISIMYNGSYMEFDDVAPELINDRTMLPFRKILETMGAEVTYDEATDTAKAVRGDTTVEFTLTGTTVTITNNGEVSTIEMDVAPVLKNDRTLVPVRFMSEALSMNVGWDDESQTVYIVDMEKYLDDIKEGAPKFYELLSVANAQPSEYVSDMTIDFSLNSETKEPNEEAEASVIELSAAIKNNKLNDVNVITLNGDLKSNADDSFSSLTSGDMLEIEDLALTTVALDDKIYMQTNMFEKLSDANPSSGKLLAAAVFVNDETWLRIERSDIEEGKFDDISTIDMIETIADMSFTGMVSGLIPSGDITQEQAWTIDIALTWIAANEQYLTVTKTGDNSYTYSFDMPDEYGTAMTISGTIVNGIETEYSASMQFNVDTSQESPEAYDIIDMSVSVTSKLDTSATPTVPEYDTSADNISLYLTLAGMM